MRNHIDILVANKVMGWEIWNGDDDYDGTFPMVSLDEYGVMLYLGAGSLSEYFSPSKDMNHAWKVIKRIREMNEYWCPVIYWDDDDGLGYPCWVASFVYYGKHTSEHREHVKTSVSAPLAICLASLEVVNENKHLNQFSYSSQKGFNLSGRRVL